MSSKIERSKASQVPAFIQKVEQIVNNKDLINVVGWTSTKDSFIIKEIPAFTERVLPKYFKHSNYASFIRQLNMYNFKKVRHPDGENVYHHEFFKEGACHLLKKIVRKVKEEKEDTLALYNPQDYQIQRKQGSKFTREMYDLKMKQSNLEDMCKHFLKQNQKLLEENQNFMKKMERETLDKETRIEQFLIELLAQKNAITMNSNNANPMNLNNVIENRGMGTNNNKMLSIMNEQHSTMNNKLGLDQDNLSINQTHKDIGLIEGQSPLQMLGKIFDSNKQIKKMKQMITNSYAKDKSSKKNKNFTIINQNQASNLNFNQNNLSSNKNNSIPNNIYPNIQESENEFNFFDDNSSVKELSVNLKPRRSESQGFLSVNDFLNGDDYSNSQFNFNGSDI